MDKYNKNIIEQNILKHAISINKIMEIDIPNGYISLTIYNEKISIKCNKNNFLIPWEIDLKTEQYNDAEFDVNYVNVVIHAKEIYKIIKENTASSYLDLFIHNNYICFNNSYFKDDDKTPINYYDYITQGKIIDIFQNINTWDMADAWAASILMVALGGGVVILIFGVLYLIRLFG